jgi:hypothetical protein
MARIELLPGSIDLSAQAEFVEPFPAVTEIERLWVEPAIPA